ncbi:DMT family transporter [Cognatishimia sp. SS12]|uniref:DMT family transporter n=1 Tax=Cognatishimia sp. SS12 TaxID=2979465 RepID=UPI00232F00DC|nr:DMT family transporter [Cognatishimia sp. SS12]MDC0738394.1 DMT family transporter [Cognatishimia sp. SS12]
MPISVSDNLRGVLLMIAAMASYTSNDTVIKYMAGDMSLSQLLVLRGVPTILLITALTYYIGALRVAGTRRDWGLVFIRSLAEAAAAYLFIHALRRMEIANATAVLQVLPLTVALGAAVLFREPLGWRRLLAIAIGFIGMLLIVRPGPDGFRTETFYVLGAVACITVRDLSARKISSAVPSLMVALCSALGVTLIASMVSLVTQNWRPVTPTEMGFLCLAAVFIGGGYLFSTMVMRVGEISFIAPFRYTSLLWAMVLGYLVFGDWPDAITLLGAAILVATGVFTLYREARAKRRQAKARRT